MGSFHLGKTNKNIFFQKMNSFLLILILILIFFPPIIYYNICDMSSEIIQSVAYDN
jgi:hypothetical protein